MCAMQHLGRSQLEGRRPPRHAEMHTPNAPPCQHGHQRHAAAHTPNVPPHKSGGHTRACHTLARATHLRHTLGHATHARHAPSGSSPIAKHDCWKNTAAGTSLLPRRTNVGTGAADGALLVEVAAGSCASLAELSAEFCVGGRMPGLGRDGARSDTARASP
mmetsp:Transcript_33128/g.98559  ORF Transcript_33128/g.98559 Transcript_33128/m.98559 type:complete len:161 (-) Transcript_33128:1348-1830(-)